MELLGSELDCPRPTTVFGLNLLALNLSDMGKESLSYVINGMALRMSHGLGLHIIVDLLVLKGKIQSSVRQSREDALWGVVVEDVLVSLYVGRLPMLRDMDHDLKLELDQRTRLIDCRGDATVLKYATLSICNIGAKVITLFYNVHNERRDLVPKVEAIRQEFTAWRQRFDPRLLPEPRMPTTAHAITCLALHKTIVILLNRPVLQRECLDSLQGTLCLSAAVDTADLMRMNHANNTLIFGPVTNSQNMHVAGSVLLLLLADLYDTGTHQMERTTAQSAVDSIFSSLGHLSTSCSIARQALSALSKMRSDYAVGTDAAQPFNMDSSFEEELRTAFSFFTDMPDPFGLDQIFRA